MSTVKLTSFFTYHPGIPVNNIVVGNVPLPEGMAAPDGGLTTLYGFRDSLAELSRWIKEVESVGMKFCNIEIEVDVGKIETRQVTPEMIANEGIRFLNMRKMASSLENVVVSKWRSYLIEEGVTQQQLAEMKWRNAEYVAHRPDLLSRLIKEPELSNLDLVVYPVETGGKIFGQKATLMSSDHVLSVRSVELPNAEVRLPAITAKSNVRKPSGMG